MNHNVLYTLFQNGHYFSIFGLIANWPFWPHSRLNEVILLNFTIESKAKRANFQGNKGILKWPPFWNKVYDGCFIKINKHTFHFSDF